MFGGNKQGQSVTHSFAHQPSERELFVYLAASGDQRTIVMAVPLPLRLNKKLAALPRRCKPVGCAAGLD